MALAGLLHPVAELLQNNFLIKRIHSSFFTYLKKQVNGFDLKYLLRHNLIVVFFDIKQYE